ncbi:MAG: hypothetical protein G01um1014106_223 [Parcubacteria group bacterium Gr01-1014_106]|nr:MAG: hypothetical protein G01um1014106_223 [Parcubacteria group bacterium Gr01-1014_106]
MTVFISAGSSALGFLCMRCTRARLDNEMRVRYSARRVAHVLHFQQSGPIACPSVAPSAARGAEAGLAPPPAGGAPPVAVAA